MSSLCYGRFARPRPPGSFVRSFVRTHACLPDCVDLDGPAAQVVSAPATTDTIANRNLLRESQNTVARLLPDVAGTYTLRLTVNDGAIACASPFLAPPTLPVGLVEVLVVRRRGRTRVGWDGMG